MTDLPAPPVPPELDIQGFSGFMLDVDRLLASELVALGTPEECWAALMLWCRAWKQSPPGSLPDDDRVLASFSGAGKRWAKVKAMALRGFVKCSDGRLYHHVLAGEAAKAWKKRQVYRNDQGRLKRWRDGKRNDAGNANETQCETRFNDVSCAVSEPVDRDSTGTVQGQKEQTSLRSVSARKRASPKTAIPADWVLSPEGRQYAKSKDYGDQWIDREAETFRDRNLQVGALYADWEAAWRKWVQNAQKFAGNLPLRVGREPEKKPKSLVVGTHEYVAAMKEAGA